MLQNGVGPVVRTQAVGLLAAGLAHDLNNMLGGIVATAELLAARRQRGGEDQRDLQAIVDQAVRASGLIRQVLAFSRQEMLKPVSVDIAGLPGSLSPMLTALAGPSIRLEIVSGAPAQVRVDLAAFERVVANLLINARDAMGPGGGRIHVFAGRIGPAQMPQQGRRFMPEGVYGVMSLEDDGPGVARAHEARIFEPYFTTRPNGQGLGLSTAYGLAKQSGGYLLHDRGPMGGARFSLYLPEDRSVAGAPRGQRLGGRVIVLAEDELLLRMSVARGLERFGYRVRQAADGEAALAWLEEGPPALLISDIRMPGLDGIELTRRARARYPRLPVLLVSGFADEAARAALPEIDVAFLAKPFTLKTLGERVRALV